MANLLARLRGDLDVLPSPLADRPGLLLRDPFRYSDAAIIVPPVLARCLGCFDGAHSDLDLRATLVQLTGRVDLAEATDGLVRALSEGGFLEDDTFHAMRVDRQRAFAEAPLREAAFAGGGYPDDKPLLTQTLAGWMADGEPAAASASFAIAAPHASPSGSMAGYGAAYRALGRDLADRTFVILGTSHYGTPNRFGLTRKPFQTPLGQAITDVELVDRLVRAAPEAVDVEDYCHAVEHSIEFQVLFLQNLYGPDVRILPILCGSFTGGSAGRSGSNGGGPAGGSRGPLPEDDRGVARTLESLAQLQATSGRNLTWVLGVDMAHVGRRYGDAWDAHAHAGVMNEVATRDRERLDRVTAGDATGFWNLLHERGRDDLKWCGSAPLYAFLRAHPGARGQLLHYGQWNIDDTSVVSYAAVAFQN